MPQNAQDLAQQVNQALDKIQAAGGDAQKIQAAVQEAKQLVQQFVQQSQQAGQGQAQR